MRRNLLLLCALAAALSLAALLSFMIGRYPISPGQVLGIMFSKILSLTPWWESRMETIFFQVRLPRVLLCVLVGGALSASGAAYQAVFANPMASPDVLGASSGAAFGAALCILLGMSSRVVALFAFAFGLAAVLLAVPIASRSRGNRVTMLVLTGIMISSLFSSGTSYIKLVADPTDQLPAITYWLMGSLAGARMDEVGLAAVPVILGIAALCALGWRLNILTLGDEEAATLGVNVRATRLAIVLCATLITAASVAVSGVIGWIGLVVPHLARKLTGNDNRMVVSVSALTGALFLLAVDNLSRTLWTSEVPLGILTAFVGAPFFVYLLSKKGAPGI